MIISQHIRDAVCDRRCLIFYGIVFIIVERWNKTRTPKVEKLEDIRNDYGSALRKILKFNEKTTGYIEKRKSEMNLPVDYIAVHIRRGDKIVSREIEGTRFVSLY